VSDDGCILAINDAVREMLAASDTFQTWVGADDAAAALSKIFAEDLPPPAGDYYTLGEWRHIRPYAMVAVEAQRKVVIGQPGDFDDVGGRVRIFLEQDVPERIAGEEASVAGREFARTMGLIMDDLADLAATQKADGSGSHPDLRTIETDEPVWMRTPPEQRGSGDLAEVSEGDAIMGAIIVEWGEGAQ